MVGQSFEDSAVGCERTFRASCLRLGRTVSHKMKKVAIGTKCPGIEVDEERRSNVPGAGRGMAVVLSKDSMGRECGKRLQKHPGTVCKSCQLLPMDGFQARRRRGRFFHD